MAANRCTLARYVASFTLLALCGNVSAWAALVVEVEAMGAAANNTVATAQAIDPSSFTTPAPDTAFPNATNNPLLPHFPTATVQGIGVGERDVDFYSFQTLGGLAYFDIDGVDNRSLTFDSILSLFDSSGTLLAFGNDTTLDPGSASKLDAFLGVYALPGPGTYYIAVSTHNNFPSAASSGTSIVPLVRPDGVAAGGAAVIGATPGDSSFAVNQVQQGTQYLLHISVESPLPEPSAIVIWGLGAICLAGISRFRKRHSAGA